ncbi:MAG: phosphatase PAP2 family protein [Spirochaetaceae bacterium]|jgi:membrane-associated phospholipid phosphatase|nr:phosphatase PAP2 family protein [Spirochaetaceae bacterium]
MYALGLELIKSLQTLDHPVADFILGLMTNTIYVYIPFTAFVFWCIDEKKGVRLGLLLLISAEFNGICKNLLKLPRPYNLDPTVGRGEAAGFGMPSGHAQLSLTFGLGVAVGLKAQAHRFKVLLWTGAIGYSFIVGFTRLYLGLHFPTDLIGGWLLGGIILGGYFFGEKYAVKLLNQGGLRGQLIALSLIALGMNALGGDKDLSGGFLGFAGGYSLLINRRPFSAQASTFMNLVIRFIIGLTGMFIIFWTLTLLFKGLSQYDLGRFVRSGAVGLWTTGGAPLVFMRLGLAEAQKDA